MQLTRIHLAQFRKFRGAIDIPDLAPGLNLFTGPNEAGKSTIAAAIRAAFFERHRSNAAEDFRPEGDTGATPAITLEFSVAGKSYRLFKQFLARKRCTLEFDGRRLDGDEAEDYLAGLMGYQYAGKGRSKAEHWGIPGLLWAEQGRSQELDLAISHAVDHLRAALGIAGGHQTEDTDQVVAAVAQQRNALLTPSSGAPRLAYAEALAKVDALSTELADTQREAQAYRQAVDRLAELKATHDRDDTEQPWLAIRAEQQQAQQQLQATRQLDQSLQAILARQQQLRETASLLQNQLQHLAAQAQTLGSRHDAVEQARLAVQQTQTAAERWQHIHRQSGDALSRSLAALEHNREHTQHAALLQQAQTCQQQLEQAQSHLAQAEAAEQELHTLQSQLAALRVDDQDLARLRELGLRRRELQIRQQANATRLQFTLQDNASILLDDTPLLGSGERLLTSDATLRLPGMGVLQIRPGGDSLDSLHRESRELDTAWDTLLAALNASSLEDIETRHAQAAQRQANTVLLQQTLRLHAPGGIDALRRDITTLQAQQADLRVRLDRTATLAAPDGGVDQAGDTDAIQDAHRAAQQAVDHAHTQWHQAQLAAGAAQAQYEHATRELLAAKTASDDPQQAEQRTQWQRRLIDTNAELAQADTQAQTLRRDLAQARPDILAQDVERLRRSADQLLQAHQQRHETLLRLDAELQALGARGLDERAATQALALAQAQRSADELARRARALDHLLALLRAKQQDATQALQAPLQARLRHYLDLLFPDAELLLDDRLVPGTLKRPGVQALRTDVLDTLSHGAREQLGVIGRLACADLLQEAGRPTLLILDDALVHTDSTRLAQMKRILFDAATRHQILLFSCHDTLWRDVGIAPRDVGTLASTSEATAG